MGAEISRLECEMGGQDLCRGGDKRQRKEWRTGAQKLLEVSCGPVGVRGARGTDRSSLPAPAMWVLLVTPHGLF